jgi:N-acetylmuramoyl-L-alanine amidase
MDDRTFVPVRFIAENLGASVGWDSSYFIVSINKKGIEVPDSAIYQINYTNDDLYWLSRIIEAEAEGEPLNGKIGVGEVVLNRVKSTDFPDTVHDVIFDANFGVQFQPVANGTIYNTPSYESTIAAKYALEGEDVVGESLYFLNLDTASSSWIPTTRTLYMQIGNHSFYL